MIVKIKRQENRTATPYWEEYEIAPQGIMTVSLIIESINYYWDNVKTYSKLFESAYKEADNNKAYAKITNVSNNNKLKRINWEHSCFQNMCGACAMIINKQPAMACSTHIDTNKQRILTIEPLSKFEVIEDLIVDRTIINKHALQASLYIDKANVDKKRQSMQYLASKCMKCGLCLEVCPKYNSGQKFFGGVFAVESYLCYSRSENKSDVTKKSYKKNFAAYCSKSGACQKICPQKIPVLAQVAQMNRLV